MEERTILLVLVLLWPEICFVCKGQYSFPRQTARQSQTYQTSTPDKAIDGDPNTCSVAAVGSGSSDIGWWQVDLGDIFSVSSVTVTSGTSDGSHPEYLQNFAIYVRDTNNTDGGNSNQCFYFNNGSFIPAGASLTFDCAPNPLNGRYVTLRRMGGFRQDAIGLCEVNIKYNASLPSTLSSSSVSSSTTAKQPNSSPASAATALNPSSTLSTVFQNDTHPIADYSQGDKTRTTIICVVVIIGGLLLLGGAAALAYFLLRCRVTKTIGGPKSIEVLPFRRMSENPYSSVSADHEQLTKPIRDVDLPLYVENKKSNPSSFKSEFKKLPEDEARETKVGRKSTHKMKNRFANVVPYDHSLVPLEIEEFDDLEGDYINANFIEGYKNVEKMYIATQGPRSNTIDDFWRMIWQQNVNLIVMVTSLIENGKKKCEKYWPENVQSTNKYHKITVTLVVEEVYAHYAYREMIVHDERQVEKPPRTVRQMHFLTWSDKTRPDHYLSLLSFRRKVRCFQSDSTDPIVVHCSAGIGRTGTYIALDILMDQLKDEHEISVFGCVETLRFQRMSMVQTAEQYVFLHEALSDGLQSGETGIPCSSFARDYIEMAKPWPDGSLSTLEQQFILLRKMKEAKTEKYSSGAERQNISKNRDKDIVACDDGRPYLEDTYYSGGDYINAVYADSYRSKDSYILTQLPLLQTIVDFWRLIWDHRLTTIVLLNEIETGDEDCPMYWPQENVSEAFGPFEVELMSTKELSSTISVREFTLTNTKERKDPLSIRQYQIKGWPNGDLVPSKPNLLLELMNILMANSTKDKLVIQCIDGAVRSGLFAAAMHLIDMMKVEQVVDVFLACRFIAINRPQVVSSMEQYSFLHELACTCLMQYEEYDNCQPVSIGHEKQSKASDFLSVYANALDSKPKTIRGLSASKPVKLGEF